MYSRRRLTNYREKQNVTLHCNIRTTYQVLDSTRLLEQQEVPVMQHDYPALSNREPPADVMTELVLITSDPPFYTQPETKT